MDYFWRRRCKHLLVVRRRWSRKVCACTINFREIPEKGPRSHLFFLPRRLDEEQWRCLDSNARLAVGQHFTRICTVCRGTNPEGLGLVHEDLRYSNPRTPCGTITLSEINKCLALFSPSHCYRRPRWMHQPGRPVPIASGYRPRTSSYSISPTIPNHKSARSTHHPCIRSRPCTSDHTNSTLQSEWRSRRWYRHSQVSWTGIIGNTEGSSTSKASTAYLAWPAGNQLAGRTIVWTFHLCIDCDPICPVSKASTWRSVGGHTPSSVITKGGPTLCATGCVVWIDFRMCREPNSTRDDLSCAWNSLLSK